MFRFRHPPPAKVTLLGLLLLAGCGGSPPPETGGDLGALLGEVEDDPGFARVAGPREFRFPEDHGAHPAYRNEWWYFTGNLTADGGRRFGYQLVIFRTALTPRPPARTSAWAAHQVYMAHFAITDVRAERFRYFERFARGALGLAGVRTSPLRIWLEDWRIEGDSEGWRLIAAQDGHAIDLRLRPRKPIVLQGEQGLSRKSLRPGHASYYYSQTRLETRGTLRLPSGDFRVAGSSWLDREWSSSALATDQVGWDWFALQLDDGYDLMFYRLRRKDGSADPASSGTLVDPEGRATHLPFEAVRLSPRGHWTSPRGGRYPLRWRLQVPEHDLILDIAPLLEQQELDVTVRYWEGAVTVSGRHGNRAVRGRGYVELTGYATTAGRTSEGKTGGDG